MQNHRSAPISSPSTPPGILEPDLELAMTIVAAAEDRKGAEITVLHVTEVSTLADYFILITGFSKVQVRAIANSIEETVAETLHRRPLRSEGKTESVWVLEDYGEVIVHIMLPQEREFYNLEAFWGHAERVELPTTV